MNISKNETHTFVAWAHRMSVITRWPLMRTIGDKENLAEHVAYTAMVAHIIALIGKNKYGKQDINPEKIAVAALYHECGEFSDGDLPSPVKYKNPEMTRVYKKLEHESEVEILENTLPDFLQDEMRPLVVQAEADPEIKAIVKAADDICALIKAADELKFHNHEFEDAHKKLVCKVAAHAERFEEVNYFVETFVPACSFTLDKLTA